VSRVKSKKYFDMIHKFYAAKLRC